MAPRAMTLRVRGFETVGCSDIVGSELTRLEAATQHEQSCVLAGVERVRRVGGGLAAEAKGLVVIGAGAASMGCWDELLLMGPRVRNHVCAPP
jgi:hypothetical protein